MRVHKRLHTLSEIVNFPLVNNDIPLPKLPPVASCEPRFKVNFLRDFLLHVYGEQEPILLLQVILVMVMMTKTQGEALSW